MSDGTATKTDKASGAASSVGCQAEHSVTLSAMGNIRFEFMFGREKDPMTAGEGISVTWDDPRTFPKHFISIDEARSYLKIEKGQADSAMITGKPVKTTVKPIESLDDSTGFPRLQYTRKRNRIVPIWLYVKDRSLLPTADGVYMHPKDDQMWMFATRDDAREYLGAPHSCETRKKSIPHRVVFTPRTSEGRYSGQCDIVTCLDPDELNGIDHEKLTAHELRQRRSMFKKREQKWIP